MSEISTDVMPISWDQFFSLERSTRARLVYVKSIVEGKNMNIPKPVPEGLPTTKFHDNLDYRKL